MNLYPGLEERLTNASPLRPLLRSVLESIAGLAANGPALRVHTVCDRDSDHYLLIAEGWQGFRRIYRVLAHVALFGSELHVFEDTTIGGIAGHLCAAGFPRDRITFAWAEIPLVEHVAGR